MAGYTRQSTADIIPTATVRAAPLNAEYNAIRDAFAASGGHKHDGTAAEGEYVPLISDLDNYNKVVIDSTNNRVGVFVEVSAAAVEQVRFQDGAIVPVTTNDIDLGTSSLKFKNLYIEGTATIGDVALAGGTIDDTVIGGTTPAAGTFTTLTATTVDLNGGNIDGTVIGATTAAAADFTTMDASGNATVGGTFGVTGNTTIGGTLGVTGVTTLGTANITSVDLNSGAIDNTTIGAATPAAGTFTVLTANTSLTAATADINGGTLDGVTIGGTVSAAATVTNLTATGTSTLSTVDINAGAIDGTTIGATSHTTGKFTTLQSTGLATLNSVNIDGGNIDGTVIGNTSAAAITGTTITGTSFVGPVTGNVTGNLTGNVTGNVTGDVTGNITSSGSSSFNNVTIDGTLNMNAGTTATITNLTSPTNTNDAATKGYVDTSISNLVDSAPGTLDTLNELAAALGDDPNFSTTITNSIATKLPLAGGTMTGAIAMSTNKITGLGDPTAAQDAMTKAYADSNYLALSGGTMTGAIDMGSAKITTTYTPTNAADLTTKTYVDGILGSATAAAASAAAAATSETNAATSESNAATSESNAAASATSAATLYDNFDDRYLGAKASAPTVDNDGDALITGALYFNTTTNIMNVYGSSGWQSAGSAVNGTSDRVTYTASSGQTVFAATYDAGYVDVYMNGVKLLAGTDFTATNGTSITLASGAAVNDIVDIVAYGTFVLADHYSKTQSDARYVEVAGDTMTGSLTVYDSSTPRITVGYSGTQNHYLGWDSSKLTFQADPQNLNSASAILFSVDGTEAMRITENQHLFVGTTDTSIIGDNSSASAGTHIQADGVNTTASWQNPSYRFNRMGNDGDILQFRFSGSPVGSIGSYNGTDTYITGGSGNSTGVVVTSNAIVPSGSAGATNTNVSLGLSAAGRSFKDLYLSGSAKLGVTGTTPAWVGSTSTVVSDNLFGFQGASYSNACYNISVDNNYTYFLHNAYYSGLGWTQRLTGYNPTMLQSGTDGFFFNRAASTGSDTAISWTALAAFKADTTVFNEGGNDIDFRVESDSDTNMLYVDAGNNRVSVGGGGPQARFNVFQNLNNSSDWWTNTRGALYLQNLNSSGHTVVKFNNETNMNASVVFNSTSSSGFQLFDRTSVEERLGIDSNELVINEGSQNFDFRVESNNQAHALFVDAGSDAVMMGKSSASNDVTTAGQLFFPAGKSIITNNGDAAQNLVLAHYNSTGSAIAIEFYRNSTPVGSITKSSSGTTYNTTSDRRLKDNIEPIADGTEKLMAMNPVTHKWKADPHTGETVHGFIAQEMQEIVPEAVSGDPDGEEMMSMDYGRITPVLVAALQDAHKKIEALEERLAELEAN